MYKHLEERVHNMAIILPLVSSLHSPAMRDRHWRTLQHLTHKQFDKGPSFALQDLLVLDLHRHVDGVNEIVQVRKGDGWVDGWVDAWMDECREHSLLYVYVYV